MQEIFTLKKECHLNKSSSIPLPSEAWQEESMEPGPKDMPPGSNPQFVPISMIEEPESEQVIEDRSDTPNPSTGEGAHHLGWSHQVSHSNNAQNPNEII